MHHPSACRLFRVAACSLVIPTVTSHAQLTFNVGGSWPNDAHRQAAVNALQAVVNRHNAYGNFGNYNIYAYYNAGIPTAQASYLGSIGYGGTYPNERVTLHEANHYLGSGTYGRTHNLPNAIALLEQFDGVGARFGSDGTHFWPYGMNYDSEWSEVGAQRNVALLYALRKDWGIGATANPAAWAATSVTLKGNDAPGESGFNFGWNWSDNTFAHPNADYATGAHAIRTPAGTPSWTFAGKSLTVNAGGSLLYNSWGTTGVITIRNLNLNGGILRHDQNAGDHFQLAGNINLTGAPIIDAGRGSITLSAAIAGSGSFNKHGPHAVTLSGASAYTGDTNINAGILRLNAVTPVASYTFDAVVGADVNNTGSGGAAMNGTLANGAAIVPGGQAGNAVALSGGASVDINNPIADLGPTGNWTVSAWVKTATPGSSILTKGAGTGWSAGNTIFYLGDGTAGGSGGIPSAVRWGGGFFQGSTAAANVANNLWHQVTYINTGGTYALYVDGIPQPLSAGNSSFSAADVGNIVRLGVSTNTVAGDGTLNFNGLMDNVHFYNQSLSTAQVSALYQGTTSFSPLPAATSINIAPGAVLDINGNHQQIGSLAGGSGSAVMLGNGKLTVDSPANTQFAGVISGSGGSLIKQGAGVLTLSAAHTYTGSTTISGGTLRLAASPVTVAHRWSFNDASLADSVGNSPASIVEVGSNNISFSTSQVTLAGGAQNVSDYISLGSGLLPKTNSPVTIELWATQNALQNWSRIFDFGSGTGENLFMSWSQGTTLTSDRVEWKDAVTSTANNTSQPFTLGTQYHIVMVLNPAGSSTAVTWYVAPAGSASLGAPRGSFTSANALSEFFDSANNLGRSFYGDNTASASYDEVRFWMGALDPATLQALHGAGPNANLSFINQPLSTGQLPSSTALNIAAAGAALDINGIHQSVASLAGVPGSFVLLGSGTLTVNGAVSTTFAGTISGGGGLIKNGPSTLSLEGTNTYAGPTTVTAGTLRIAQTQVDTSQVAIGAGATVVVAGANTVLRAPVSLAGTIDAWTATLDLTDGALILQPTNAAEKAARLVTLANQIASARAGNTWTGQGITSSSVALDPDVFGLALVDNADLHLTSFRGLLVDDNSLLVTKARLGDATLDGIIDAFDLNLLAANWQSSGTDILWSDGDFTGDGMVNAFDLNLLAAHWQSGTSLSTALASLTQNSGLITQGFSPVPEPTSLALLVVGALPLMRRRRP